MSFASELFLNYNYSVFMKEYLYRSLYLSLSCQETPRNLRWIDKYILTENLVEDMTVKKICVRFRYLLTFSI